MPHPKAFDSSGPYIRVPTVSITANTAYNLLTSSGCTKLVARLLVAEGNPEPQANIMVPRMNIGGKKPKARVREPRM